MFCLLQIWTLAGVTHIPVVGLRCWPCAQRGTHAPLKKSIICALQLCGLGGIATQAPAAFRCCPV
jgi:hypothetical protein